MNAGNCLSCTNRKVRLSSTNRKARLELFRENGYNGRDLITRSGRMILFAFSRGRSRLSAIRSKGRDRFP